MLNFGHGGASTSDIVFGGLCFGAISCGVGYRICFVVRWLLF